MPETQPQIRPRTWFFLAVIVGIAAVTRFIYLESAPVGGHGDVAWIGINALDWVDNGVFPYYIWELYAPEPMIVQLTALAFPFTGVSYLASRTVTALFGVLLVALLFPATWWLLDGVGDRPRERAALLASLAAALSIHANYISRLGMRAALFPALLALLVWLTLWAWKRGGWWRWALAGAALALMQYNYIPARLVPVVLALWFAHGCWSQREQWRLRWRGWIIMAAVAFVLALPNIVTFLNTPEAFSARADVGSAGTGGWIWNFDTSAEGGLGVLLLKKIALEFLAFGTYWLGPYNVMQQPMLGPLFYIGFLAALVMAFRFPRQIATMWPLLAIPVMFSTDLISGAVAEIHAVRQTGVLPFVFILSGIGLAVIWGWLESRLRAPAAYRELPALLLLLAVLPAGYILVEYLGSYIPAQYADPATGISLEQTDVDISRAILENPDQAYLLPYDEYNRSNIAYLVSATFRTRHSAINGSGMLQIENPPEALTIVTASEPYRIRHDGRPSQWDTRLWVLLYNQQAWLLPPLTHDQETAVLGSIESAEAQSILDRSSTEIAQSYTINTPEGLFAPRGVPEHPMDAVFRLPGESRPDEVRLMGYDVPDIELHPGSVYYVTLYWQALRRTSEDYEIFVQIWNDAGEVLAQTHDFPYGGMYRSRIWRRDEITATHHWLQLPDEIPVGRYTLVTGLYRVLQNEPLAVSGANSAENGRAALARDLRSSPPPVVSASAPPPQPLQFGDLLTTTGLNVYVDGDPVEPFAEWEIPPGASLSLDVTWNVLERPALDYSLFLHLTAEDDAPPIAQADQPLGGGRFPSGAWRPGDMVMDSVSLMLPEELQAGRYSLWMGVYYYGDNSRLTPLLDGAPQADGRVRLGTVHIKQAAPLP